MITCLASVTSDAVTNTDIRSAFGLDEKDVSYWAWLENGI